MPGNILPVVIGIIRNKDQVLLAIRPPHVPSPGLWEFPGGKIETNETPLIALQRELKEEIGIDVITANFWRLFEYHKSKKYLHLHVFFVEEFIGTPQGCEGQVVMWRAWKDLHSLSFPPANAAVLQALEDSSLRAGVSLRNEDDK